MPCQVIAPALTPRKPGERIKTDRRDAAKLVRLFRAEELTPIHVPDEAAEALRDLLRCREDLQEDLLRWRHRLGKFLARHGRIYGDGRNWTQRHWTWLRGQRFAEPVLERTYAEYRFTVEQLLARVADLDREIATLAETAPYREAGNRVGRGGAESSGKGFVSTKITAESVRSSTTGAMRGDTQASRSSVYRRRNSFWKIRQGG